MEEEEGKVEDEVEAQACRTPWSKGSSEDSLDLKIAAMSPVGSEAETEAAVTPGPVRSLQFEEPESGEKQKMQVQENIKVQYGLEKFFFKRDCRPAIEEHCKKILKDEAILKKKGPGRLSNAALALQEARKKGEVLVLASLKDYNKAVEAAANVKMKLGECMRTREVKGNAKTKMEGDHAVLIGVSPNSNRPLKGAAKKRNEEGAATKLEMAKQMERMKPGYADLKSWRKGMVKLYGKPWKQLKLVVEGKEEWEDRVKRLKLGKGSTGSTGANGTGSKGGRMLKKGGIGARNCGGGRKDKFSHIKIRVKHWLEKERSLCHHVDQVDLVEEFLEQCQDEVEECTKEEESKRKAEEKEEGDDVKEKLVKKASWEVAVAGEMKVTPTEDLVTAEEYVKQLEDPEQWREMLQDRIDKLKSSVKYVETFGARLLRDIGAKLMKPGRMSVLSMEEEEQRVKATWRDFDAVLWLAAFGSEEDLAKYVGCPQKFMEDRSEVIIGFSDQIPVWVKIGRKKEVFCEREVKPRLESKDFLKMQKEKMKEQIKKEMEGKGKSDEEEKKPVEDSKPDEEEKEKVEDSKPDEEEKKGVEGCKPGRDEDEESYEGLPALLEGGESSVGGDEEPPVMDSDDEDEDEDVNMQDILMQDDNLEKEMEGVEMIVTSLEEGKVL